MTWCLRESLEQASKLGQGEAMEARNEDAANAIIEPSFDLQLPTELVPFFAASTITKSPFLAIRSMSVRPNDGALIF